MALLDSEVVEARYHSGWNVLEIDAEPYIGVPSIFDQVIQPYITSGASTTSTTAITAATTPTAATLTLASATGFSAGNRVVVDVDSLQEEATVRSVSGSTIVVLLEKAHSGTYPVTVEGGEAIVRRILQKLRSLHGVSGSMTGGASAASGGLAQVDEVKWHASTNGRTQFEMLADQVMYWRDELCSALGIENRWRRKNQGSLTLSLY
jgi:hypothetical protein